MPLLNDTIDALARKLIGGRRHKLAEEIRDLGYGSHLSLCGRCLIIGFLLGIIRAERKDLLALYQTQAPETHDLAPFLQQLVSAPTAEPRV